MARPIDAGSFAEAVYAQLAPLQFSEERLDYPLLKFVGGLGQMLQPLDELVHVGPNGEPGWSIVLDINRVPDYALPWLGQWLGVQVDVSLSPADQRQQIRESEGWQRGTVSALRRAIQRSGGLTGNMSVIIRERDTSAYHFKIFTYPDETIGTLNETYTHLYNDYLSYDDLYGRAYSYADLFFGSGEALVYKAILAAKPAGLQFTYSVAYPQDYWGLWADYLQYSEIYNGFATYSGLYNRSSVSGAPGATKALFAANTYQDIWNDLQTYQDAYELYYRY